MRRSPKAVRPRPSRLRWAVAALTVLLVAVAGVALYRWAVPTFPPSIWHSRGLGDAGESPEDRSYKAFPVDLHRGARVRVRLRRGSVENGIRIAVGMGEPSALYVPTRTRLETERGTWELCTLDPDQGTGWRVVY